MHFTCSEKFFWDKNPFERNKSNNFCSFSVVFSDSSQIFLSRLVEIAFWWSRGSKWFKNFYGKKLNCSNCFLTSSQKNLTLVKNCWAWLSKLQYCISLVWSSLWRKTFCFLKKNSFTFWTFSKKLFGFWQTFPKKFFTSVLGMSRRSFWGRFFQEGTILFFLRIWVKNILNFWGKLFSRVAGTKFYLSTGTFDANAMFGKNLKKIEDKFV